MEIWEPKPPGGLWATPSLLRDSFNFNLSGAVCNPSLWVYECNTAFWWYGMLDSQFEPTKCVSPWEVRVAEGIIH